MTVNMKADKMETKFMSIFLFVFSLFLFHFFFPCKYLLSTYHVPDTILDAKDEAKNRTKVFCPHGAHILEGKITITEMQKDKIPDVSKCYGAK